MKRRILFLLIGGLLIAAGFSSPARYTIIEDFDSGEVNLRSFSERDTTPDAWGVDSTNTYNDSEFSLKLYGNNWKLLEIEPLQLDASSVWQVACYVEELGGIHGFGVTDGENVLLYSFAGEEMLDIEEWITVYQGYFPDEEWNLYKLPVGDDWLSWHRYKPEITGLIFINDNENSENQGVVYFDYITDITAIIPQCPEVQIAYQMGAPYRGRDRQQYFAVTFESRISDPNFSRHRLLWSFGDGTYSSEIDPVHVYRIGDEHSYTVFLQAENEAGKRGFASLQLEIPEDESSLPLKLNFVGDVMLARRYEEPGGIIPIMGVEAIFEPTLHILGDAADITVINLEAPFTTSVDNHPTKGIGFAGNPDNVAGLVYGGIDVVTLANNHILDFMLSGLQETQSVLDSVGILHCGAGANSYEAYLPAFVTKKGINVAFVASCDRTGQYNNFQPYLNAGYDRPGFAMLTPYYVRKQIHSVRDKSDLVVALLHSGSEYSREPISHYDVDMLAYGEMDVDYRPDNAPAVPPLDNPKMWDRDIRHFIIDSGADLVINHHSHIIQGLELYKGKLIAHSLGNFIFDSQFPETMPTMILDVEADKEGFTAFSITPVFVDDFIPREAKGELANYILDYVAQRSKDLDTYLHVDREANRAYVITDTLNVLWSTVDAEGVLVFDEYDEGEELIYRSRPLKFARNAHPAFLDQISPAQDYRFRVGRELVWYNNFEDEGANLWNLEQQDVDFDTEISYRGERSLRLARTAGTGNLVSSKRERVRIFEPEKEFSIHGYIKTENVRNVNIEYRLYRTRWSAPFLASHNLTVPISGTMDWTFFHKDILAHAETRTADIFFKATSPDSGTGYAWFDDVGIIEWEEWTDYYDGKMIVSPNDYYYIQFESVEPVDTAHLVYVEKLFEQGFPPTSVPDEHLAAALPAQLTGNFPNPFNAETRISFSVNRPGNVNLSVYNIKGQRVHTLMDRYVEGNSKLTVVWEGMTDNGREVASGVYFLQLKHNEEIVGTRKSLLLK